MALKPTPNEVVEYGAESVKLARLQAAASDQAVIVRQKLIDMIDMITDSGVKVMELGEALTKLSYVIGAEGHARESHNSLRLLLVREGFKEPTDAQILRYFADAPVATAPIAMGGGGGGGKRGGR